MRDFEPRRINLKNLGKFGTAALAATVAIGACASSGPSREEQARASSKYATTISNSHGLHRDQIACYSTDKPILTVNSSKADVKITNTHCFGDTDSFGITYDTSYPQIEVVGDSVTVTEIAGTQ